MTFRWYSLVLFKFVFVSCALAQQFVQITDAGNPVTTTKSYGNYAGISWVDFDNDNDLDLFVNSRFLFRNDGSETFTAVEPAAIGAVLTMAAASGNSWADYDNDGDIDVLFSSARSVVYTNTGSLSGYTFSAGAQDQIGDPISNRGWAGAWGDYDNDGFVDFIITHPQGFVGTPTTNHLYRNIGDGRFERIMSGDVVQDLAPYTVATWSDFDLDGDLDLFIGSGPATGNSAKDYLFKNMLKETGLPTLSRITEGIIATDLVDGQVWNWIDYDNDGDLDAFLTNYGAADNSLYKNESGSYVKMTAAQVGPIVSHRNSLSNIWGDVDNDGDLDCFITRDGANTSLFFLNNGNGTFTQIDTSVITAAASAHVGAAFGDFDNDGDLDMAVVNTNQPTKLYRNTLNSSNAWIEVNTAGSVSNRSAIGAKVRVKATVGGKSYWQMREISSQNSFNGHNMLRAHIGLGDAVQVDSLMVEWPSGQSTLLVGVPVNQIISLAEVLPTGFLRPNFTADTVSEQIPFTAHFTDISQTDPAAPVTSWQWDLNGDGSIDATVKEPSWQYVTLDTVTITLIAGTGTATDTITRAGYIKPKKPAPIIEFDTQGHDFGSVDVHTAVIETTVYVHNRGKGGDTVTASIKYGTSIINLLKPDSVIEVHPVTAILGGNDSVGVTYKIFPSRITSPSSVLTYAPRLVIDVRTNDGQKRFEKPFTIKLTGVVNVRREDGKPDRFDLEQNFPNPFNPVTTIRYHVPSLSDVTLRLFDIVGREIATVVNARQHSGIYSVDIDGGKLGLTSGVYLYSMTAASFSMVKKLVVVK
ncbi:MAG: FG-GAP-like repeat-containing protein [Bacteroidota bacterium]